MPDTDDIFSEEYQSRSETTASQRKPSPKTADAIQRIEDETEEDRKRYISGKPRRKRLRAKIIHDED